MFLFFQKILQKRHFQAVPLCCIYIRIKPPLSQFENKASFVWFSFTKQDKKIRKNTAFSYVFWKVNQNRAFDTANGKSHLTIVKIEAKKPQEKHSCRLCIYNKPKNTFLNLWSFWRKINKSLYITKKSRFFLDFFIYSNYIRIAVYNSG